MVVALEALHRPTEAGTASIVTPLPHQPSKNAKRILEIKVNEWKCLKSRRFSVTADQALEGIHQYALENAPRRKNH